MPLATALAYVAAAVLIVWGTRHVVATRPLADSFGAISADNRNILVMEWVAEGVTHVSIGLLVILATATQGSASATAHLVYAVCAGVLVVLAVLTAATGARTALIWFRVCPFILAGAAALLVAAALV